MNRFRTSMKNKKELFRSGMNLFKENSLIDLLIYVKPKKTVVFIATMFSALNKICDILPEILIAMSVDVVVQQKKSIVSQLSGISEPLHQLYLVAGITALIWILESIFEYLYFIVWHGLAQKIQHDLRLATYEKIQSLDLAYFEDKTTGGMLTILQDDVSQLEQFLSLGPNEVIQLTVNILVTGAIFVWISPALCFLTLIPIPFVVAISYYFQHKLSGLYFRMRNVSSSMASHIVYRLQGLMTIKSYGTQKYELGLLAQESNKNKQAYGAVNSTTAKYIPCIRMTVMIGFITTMIVGGMKVLSGQIAIHWYAELVVLTQRFLWPFSSLTVITDTYEKSFASAKRIMNVLQTEPEIRDGDNAIAVRSCPGSIVFDNVSFSYKNGYEVFKDLNLTIPARTTVAFVGSTGCGKSTLSKLILRFYDVQGGAVKIDGSDVKNIKEGALHASIGLVSQEVYIVDGTISENIAYGTFDAPEEEIFRVSQMAQCHDFIMELPDGYHTKLSEHGKNLSGGQRQRISIARALLKKSCILIFDEATAALDNETEAEITHSMERLKKDHTIIIIAHRLSTVRDADTIFVLDNGKIVESGSHDELLVKKGAYAQLWNMQVS